jgi:type I restriction enzyme S subunit
MNKLEQLIKELCPNGVEFIDIKCLLKSNIVTTITPSIKIKRNDYKEFGTTPIVSQEEEFISGYCDMVDRNIPKNNYICFGDHSEHIKYIAFSFVQGADGLKIIRINENAILAKYLYYAICNFYKKHNNYERHFKYLLDTKIPVPPLPVQSEIVRILDNFAELTARKKQYEYYRNKLLFQDRNVQEKALGELCNISAGGDAPKNATSQIKTIANTVPIISNGVGNNAIYGYTNKPKITQPAVTIAARGTIGYAAYRNYPYFPIIRLLSAIPQNNKELNTKYLYYCLQGKKYRVPDSGIPQLTAPMLKKEKIPVPPIEEQERIVAILDRFDTLCNDLTSGLPAEIAARKKQYEYYRDKLLTFKEKVV